MPVVRKSAEHVEAIVVADVHLSHAPPVGRSAEADWYEAMRKPLQQVSALAEQYKAPVIYAGDLFHTWKVPPELITFALAYLPKGYAIPGNHDVPFHSYDLLNRSAYWTLMKCGHLTNLEPNKTHGIGGMAIRAFPFGFKSKPLAEPHTLAINVAIVHDYIWKKGSEYVGADKANRADSFVRNLAGFDLAVFGDNHQGFSVKDCSPTIFNCGCLIRRRTNEIDLTPSVGLIMGDGTIKRHFLDVDGEKFIDVAKAVDMVEDALNLDFSEVLADLKNLSNLKVGFFDALLEAIRSSDNVREGAKEIIKAIIGGEGKK